MSDRSREAHGIADRLSQVPDGSLLTCRNIDRSGETTICEADHGIDTIADVQKISFRRTISPSHDIIPTVHLRLDKAPNQAWHHMRVIGMEVVVGAVEVRRQTIAVVENLMLS